MNIIELRRTQAAKILYCLRTRLNGMRQRCNNPNNNSYKWYGARGIQVKFESSREFICYVMDDLGYNTLEKLREIHNLVIDRIDNSGHYEPGNIRFVTTAENIRNRGPTTDIIHLVRDALDYCIEKYQLPPIALRFGEYGQIREQPLTIRVFWYQVKELTIASLLHEVAYLIWHYKHKKPPFMDTERTLLADFNLRPVRYNRQTSRYATLQTIDKKHYWDRTVVYNQPSVIEGTLRPWPRPQIQPVHVYVQQVYHTHPDQDRLKRIHRRCHPGAC